MKQGVLALLLGAVAGCNTGQAPAGARAPDASVPTNTRIVSHDVKSGPLRVAYSDGTIVEIPKERGRFGNVDGLLTQDAFTNIQIHPAGQHIGWLAEYMMCAQSYPCPMELVIFHAGRGPRGGG